MDLMELLDVILHIGDSTVFGEFIAEYGTMVYVVLTGIVFAETGLVIFPFLPGDSLLFVAGAFSASGALKVWALMVLLVSAAVIGNTVNYLIGRAIGQKVFTQDYRWIDKAALRKTHAFYEHHGGKTIILSRFVPVVRTFAPFVAGVSAMNFGRFQFYNVSGALIWVVGLVTAGYFFGNIPIVRDHLSTIVLIGISAAVVPLVMGALWKFYKRLTVRG